MTVRRTDDVAGQHLHVAQAAAAQPHSLTAPPHPTLNLNVSFINHHDSPANEPLGEPVASQPYCNTSHSETPLTVFIRECGA